MRLRCNKCGKVVSTEIPDDTIVRAWLECPECLDKEANAIIETLPDFPLPDQVHVIGESE